MRLALGAAAAGVAAALLLFGGLGRGGDAAAEPAPFDSAAAVSRGLVALDRARVAVDPGRYPVAEREFREALRLGGSDAAALRGLAALAAARHRFDESLRLAERARALGPDSATAYALIGDALIELGRFDEAHAAFDRMALLKPSAGAYARISYARELLGDDPGALEAMRLSAEAAGTPQATAWALAQLGTLFAGRGKLETAEAEHRRALRVVDGYGPALVGLADVELRRDRPARAERLLRRALARVPDPAAAVALADALAAQGRTAESERWLDRAQRLEGEFARYGGRNEIETALVDLDHDRKLEDALARARVGLSRRPGVEGLHTYAWALYKNGRCAEAVPYSDRALALAPTDTGALAHRELIERCLGRDDAADRFAARLRTLDPTFPPVSAYRLP